MADDDFTLDGDSSNVETSLDDFFQPAAGPEKKAEPQSATGAYETAPVPKGEPLPEISEVEPVSEEQASEPRRFLSSRILIIVVVVLGVAVLGAGGYFAYTMFLAKDSDLTWSFFASEAPAPVEKPVTALEPETGEGTGITPSEASAPPDRQEGGPGESAVSEAGPEGPSAKAPGIKEAKETAKAPDVPAATIPIQEPASTRPIKTAAVSKGPYTIQVGSYMMKESMAGPEQRLARLGFSDYHYVDTKRTMRVYDVYAGGVIKRSEAEEIKAELAAIGFKPSLKKQKGDSYRVLAYSYGSRSVANQSKAKIEKAGISKVEVKTEKRTVTLHQLRVGHFSSSRSAQSAINTLKKAGFDTILIKEK